MAAKPDAVPLPPPYWSAKGLLLSLIAAVLLSWPALVMDGPLVYADTGSYHEAGEKMVGVAESRIAALSEADEVQQKGAPNGTNSGIEGIKLRSIPYSIYTYITAASPLGLWLTCLIQATIVLFAAAALIPRIPLSARMPFSVGLAAIAVFSSLPWFVSYAMPDLLAALVVIFYLLQLRLADGIGAKGKILLVAMATAAILAHYGNIPLAAGLAAAVIVWRWFEKSLALSVIALCLAPVVFAAAFNLAGGKVSTGEESVAPKRLPILLARSLEDGPARWYLEDACKSDRYTICEVFDTIPDNVGSFLWGEDGFRRATDAQVEAIRAEEREILLEAFKRYPLTQTRALFGNALLQTVSVGTGELWPLGRGGESAIVDRVKNGGVRAERDRFLLAFDVITPLATFLAIAILLYVARRRGISYSWWVMIGFTIVALLLNAAIFGGLSAPVDRYQSRIIWLLPAILVLSVATDRGRLRRSHEADGQDR